MRPSPKFMAVAAMLVMAFVLAGPVKASAESGTFADCLLGCLPGENQCTSCCEEAFQATLPASCYAAYRSCVSSCQGQEGTRAVACYKQCRDNLKACPDAGCSAKGEFSCPGWEQPQKCPHECQAWDPVLRKCVGAPQKACD
ncbi:hypothetical protein GM415_01175 [Pseudodesulfovibrio cashew]|uniref:Uncharacterized protein n=1 Tax=Pseudodesulfovibrio cashew TaxID=2678688 RepID=A0A6I6J8B8_9BACT|nr:hypothetical protein [Pseudodesulfovibrio cashew]QGY38805.1 hypothetical protein GM415_01175 [Pseudodesulfovibrio cashew]